MTTHHQQLAELKTETLAILDDIREIEKKMPPPVDLDKVIREALKPPAKETSIIFAESRDFREGAQIPVGMPVSTATLAKAYRQSRRRCQQLQVAAGPEVVRDPDKLFQYLLGHSCSPLRKRLADPDARQQIREKLNNP